MSGTFCERSVQPIFCRVEFVQSRRRLPPRQLTWASMSDASHGSVVDWSRLDQFCGQPAEAVADLVDATQTAVSSQLSACEIAKSGPTI